MLSLYRLSNIVLNVLLGITVLVVQTEASNASVIPADVSLPLPTFEPIYDCSFFFPPNLAKDFIPGPFGARAFFQFEGANFTDSKTGEVVATILPGLGGGFGIRSSVNDKFYVDATMVIRFLDDGEFAYLKLDGIGSVELHASSFAVIMETASPSRQELAKKFQIFSNVFLPTDVNSTTAYFRLFAKNSPGGTLLG